MKEKIKRLRFVLLGIITVLEIVDCILFIKQNKLPDEK